LDNNTKVQIKKILVPIDGSECSLYAAKYATKIAKDENAQLYCIHVITSVPYGIANAPAIDEYFKDYATIKDIDLIVIGTRGRTGLKRFLMGSLANGVVQHAHCSVLLVR
jgi:nucleotide-binding universal stress UspA family protein